MYFIYLKQVPAWKFNHRHIISFNNIIVTDKRYMNIYNISIIFYKNRARIYLCIRIHYQFTHTRNIENNHDSAIFIIIFGKYYILYSFYIFIYFLYSTSM